MGIEVEPGEKGIDCPTCTPDIWAPGETPKYLLLNVWGIVRCPWVPEEAPPVPNGMWILEQLVLSPCRWQFVDEDYTISFHTSILGTTCHLRSGVWSWFLSEIPELCWAYHSNRPDCIPDVSAGAGGTAFIDLYDFPGTAYQLLHDYGLAPTDYTKFDVFPVAGEPTYVQVRRFGNVRTPTNVKIKTDATHKDQYEMFEA